MAKKSKETQSSSLITALKFIELAQKDIGDPIKRYCRIANNTVIGSDGILTAGHLIEEDLEARPHTKTLIKALSQCGKTLSITQLKNERLSIRSGKFFVYVPCYTEELQEYLPDPKIAPITDSVKKGFQQIHHLADDKAQTVIQSSVLLKSGSMMSTNAVVALEYWHGMDLPTLIVPKLFVSAVANCSKKLVAFGFSPISVTFWFDDDSWLKTQCYGEEWPELSYIFDNPPETKPLTPKFWEAVRAVEDFSEDGKEKGTIYLSENGIRSHATEGEGAFFEFKGLSKIAFSIRQLKNIEKSCKTIGFYENKAWFFGDNIRGAIMGVK